MKGQRAKGKRGKGRGDYPNRRERTEESLVMGGRKDLIDGKRKPWDKDNDWTWYAHNAQLVKDYASYAFGVPVGVPLSDQNNFYSESIPGVVAYNYVPSIGVANSETSPINVAMRKLYSYVRHANSGAKNYDAPDLMLYIIAVDSARMYLEWMKRIYGVMFNYTAFNRYYPRALVTLMNGNFADLENKLADFRGYINQYAVKLNQLWVPAGLSYTERHKWMCQHIYVDSATSAKAQTFFYNPVAFYQFTVRGEPAVGSCKVQAVNSPMTLAQMITFGNGLLNPLITNEDIGIMSGDILKAYGTGGVDNVYGISEDFRVLPEYSEEVMSQIENLNIVDMYLLVADLDVTQDTTIGGGYLISKPKMVVRPDNFEGTATAGSIAPSQGQMTTAAQWMLKPLTGSRLLNMHMQDVSPEKVIVATRGMVTVGTPSATEFENSTKFGLTVPLNSCGSDIVISGIIGHYNKQGVLVQTPMHTIQAAWVNAGNSQAPADASHAIFNLYAYMSQFDWHPQMCPFLFNWTSASANINVGDVNIPFMDVDNYTFIDEANIANMHAVALLSMFTIPMIG